MENVNEEKGESLISNNVHVIRSRLIETVYKYNWFRIKLFQWTVANLEGKNCRIEILIILVD